MHRIIAASRLRGRRVEEPPVTDLLILETTSTDSAWKAGGNGNKMVNNGSTIVWNVTGSVTYTNVVEDNPTFDFSGNTGTLVITAANVEEIGDRSLGYKNITSVILAESVIKLGFQCFPGNQISELIYTNTPITFDGSGFFTSNHIDKIIVPYWMTNIPVDIYRNNLLVGEITIPEHVTNIRQGAFQVNQITIANIPLGCTVATNAAFDYGVVIYYYGDSSLLTKTASNGWGNAGAESLEKIVGDGIFSTEILETKSMAFGLSYTSINNDHFAINFGIQITTTGEIRLRELTSVIEGFGNVSAGDIFLIERIGTTIYYSKNGSPIHTSATAATNADMIATCSLNENGSTIYDAKINGDLFNWIKIQGCS